jgi:hypothetical protein
VVRHLAGWLTVVSAAAGCTSLASIEEVVYQPRSDAGTGGCGSEMLCDFFERAQAVDGDAYGDEQGGGTLRIEQGAAYEAFSNLVAMVPASAVDETVSASLVRALPPARTQRVELTMKLPVIDREAHLLTFDFSPAGRTLLFLFAEGGKLYLAENDQSSARYEIHYMPNEWQRLRIDFDTGAGAVASARMFVNDELQFDRTLTGAYPLQTFMLRMGVDSSKKGPRVEVRFDALRVSPG